MFQSLSPHITGNVNLSQSKGESHLNNMHTDNMLAFILCSHKVCTVQERNMVTYALTVETVISNSFTKDAKGALSKIK